MFARNVKVIKGKLKSGEVPKVYGLPGGSKAFLLKELISVLSPAILIAPTDQQGEALSEDLKRLGIKTLFLPAWDVPPLDISSPLSLYQFRKMKALYSLLTSDFDFIVATPFSLFQRVIPPETLIELTLEIKRGEEVDYGVIPERLTEIGYRRVDAEPEEGEFSLKGDKLELVTLESERLVVEFFGDLVERISVNGREVDSFTAVPLLELPASKEILKPLEDNYPEIFERHLLLGEISGAEKLLPEVFNLVPVTEYTGNLPAIVLEPDQVRTARDSFFSQVKENWEILKRESVPASPPEKFIWNGKFEEKLLIYEKRVKGAVDFSISPLPPAEEGETEEILKGLSGLKVRFIYQTEVLREEAEKAAEKLGLDVSFEKSISSGGFRFEEKGTAWVAEGEIPIPKGREEDVTALEPGTLVVHRDYGIGLFQGIVSREIGGKTYDFVEIEYAGGEKLYAPFTQLDRIYRYSGYKGKSPKLDRLGGTSWKNLERKIKASLLRFAKELAELYKERKRATGEKLKGDEKLIKAFEEKFPYRLTPDQSRAIKEVYRDMESEKPMDRLLCGDVGFGKTEVAMRAAMKAVTSGKQVAVIVPTTVLADQHYRTFKKRFEGFPVEIEMISRFKSKKEQKEILERLKRGEIDIIIGTHRLTQDDVEFKDLGLLIIDEEHRFGVKTKEKLTKMKANLDVLYLSATPIPRTLYSALSGFRDISLIETPPAGRRGTKVVVGKYSDKILKTAIERELERGGQVFIVQNDIDALEEIREKVASLFPKTPIEVVHGQMRGDRIERIMHKFFEGEIKILIATSIVESGIDVPTANTLIVIGAEKFGLSQLYQLKGRVGRGVEKGYCYLLTSPKAKLTPEAVKRLEAMKKISPLGGGFQLAMKDLEIRGAGTLLGPKQSGFVQSIGLDLYLKLFEEAVKEKEEEDVKITVPVEAYIPEDFIEDERERLKLYAELGRGKGSEEILSKLKELRGYLPDPLVNMFKVMKLKRIAKELGVKEITLSPSGKAIIAFGDSAEFEPEAFVNFVKEKGATFTPDRKLYVETGDLDGLIKALEELRRKR